MPESIRSGDGTVVKYKTIGSSILSPAGSPGAATFRPYIPGNSFGLPFAGGPSIVAKYATGVFRPGTRIRWEPSVSPTIGGRVFLGFSDNPEVMEKLLVKWSAYNDTPTELTYAAYANSVKALANTVSWPLWQEHDITVPTRLRRKRFDCNAVLTYTDTNVLDRSAQTMMFAVFDGFNIDIDVSPFLGSFWYHDVVDVEGLHGEST
nr:hypothetical protein [Tolivirales sp.]